VPRALNEFQAVALSTKAYELGEYEFSLRISRIIPAAGKIVIAFNTDISVKSNTYCSRFMSAQFAPSAKCTRDTGANTVTLHDIFPSSDFTNTAAQLKFRIANVLNPRSLSPSAPIKAYTQDSDGFSIEQSLETAFVTMATPKQLLKGFINVGNHAVGATARYAFRLWASVPVHSGDVVMVTVPPEITSYVSESITGCYGSDPLKSSLSCSGRGRRSLRLVVETPGGRPIDANRVIGFAVEDIALPGSTRPTEPFAIEIYDSKLNLVNEANPSLNGLRVRAHRPAPFRHVSVSKASNISYMSTTYYFNIVTDHILEERAKL